MATYKDEAIVLRRLDYSETSQVLAFFGRAHGQVRLIAKGIKRGTKKAFATGIDLLEAGRVVYTHAETRSGLGTLTEWRQTEGFLALRSRLPGLYAAQYAAEITAALTEEADPHPELYDELLTLFRALAGEAAPGGAVVRFQRALLESIGLLPVFEACAGCQRRGESARLEYFSAGQGGMLCRDCEPSYVEKRRVPAGLAAALARGHVPADRAGEAFELLNYAIGYTMGRPPKLAPYIQFSP